MRPGQFGCAGLALQHLQHQPTLELRTVVLSGRRRLHLACLPAGRSCGSRPSSSSMRSRSSPMLASSTGSSTAGRRRSFGLAKSSRIAAKARRFQATTWLTCTPKRYASSAVLASSRKTALAILGLNAGEKRCLLLSVMLPYTGEIVC